MNPLTTLWLFEARDTYHGTVRRGMMDSDEFGRYMKGVAQTEDVCVVATPLRHTRELLPISLAGIQNFGGGALVFFTPELIEDTLLRTAAR